nr:substrate-binding domain-containing protein [Tessaracoccus coleopterorum]
MDVANPFFADLLRGAQKELSSNGFGATIGDADNNADLQQKVLRSFLAQRVRGVILGPIGKAPSVVDELQRAGIPTVLVDRAASDKGACTVGMDDEAGGRMAVEHLLRRGHRSVAFVGGPATLDQVRDRLSGPRPRPGRRRRH